MEGVLIRAIEQKQKLEMIYLDADGQMSQRIIRVLGVRNEDILAYCYSRRKVRTFKKVRVLSVAPLVLQGRRLEAQ
ncbi:hypothetical protein [Halobacillus naozhouensis]|uniref:WYL domain-containing protein n=1 Tax=Halobacillus naozhouensis TaxID=554880 RepID=A0ABY8J4B7_9BACI|nr:hypothetical protein [Halobacillus naozhouensis]WFT76284.1 hypothetical protein P9989_07945 [Halobacillus naozhouensis]